ncbi:MAG: DNA double-strand break repair nuclease NurA [Gloeomargarita sp. SKYB31]|nr:DNA double-strand break repair nuclease NurA [Gloeomargarita sp. SKYB31]
MTNSSQRPFGELPAALVDEILQRTENLSQTLLEDFKTIRARRQEWRKKLAQTGALGRTAELPYTPIPTTCGVDGSYAIERLLASDLVAAAAVAVEGLTPPSETRHWPEPRHQIMIETEPHEAEIGIILRAVMIGMELLLASQAPHQVIFLDGSLTTPLIYFNQALNKSKEVAHLRTTTHFLGQAHLFLEAYSIILASDRSDHCWIGVPKYTTRREIGQELQGDTSRDDRSLLTVLLEPGEYTHPRPLQQPSEPWHLNRDALALQNKDTIASTANKILASLRRIRVVYHRPYPWLPALRLEMSPAVAENRALLATVLQGVQHQCGTPTVLEPYPLYMADRMAKHLPAAIPSLRQVTTQRLAETYQGDLSEIFLGLHGYRTEGGV